MIVPIGVGFKKGKKAIDTVMYFQIKAEAFETTDDRRLKPYGNIMTYPNLRIIKPLTKETLGAVPKTDKVANVNLTGYKTELFGYVGTKARALRCVESFTYKEDEQQKGLQGIGNLYTVFGDHKVITENDSAQLVQIDASKVATASSPNGVPSVYLMDMKGNLNLVALSTVIVGVQQNRIRLTNARLHKGVLCMPTNYTQTVVEIPEYTVANVKIHQIPMNIVKEGILWGTEIDTETAKKIVTENKSAYTEVTEFKLTDNEVEEHIKETLKNEFRDASADDKASDLVKLNCFKKSAPLFVVANSVFGYYRNVEVQKNRCSHIGDVYEYQFSDGTNAALLITRKGMRNVMVRDVTEVWNTEALNTPDYIPDYNDYTAPPENDYIAPTSEEIESLSNIIPEIKPPLSSDSDTKNKTVETRLQDDTIGELWVFNGGIEMLYVKGKVVNGKSFFEGSVKGLYLYTDNAGEFSLHADEDFDTLEATLLYWADCRDDIAKLRGQAVLAADAYNWTSTDCNMATLKAFLAQTEYKYLDEYLNAKPNDSATDDTISDFDNDEATEVLVEKGEFENAEVTDTAISDVETLEKSSEIENSEGAVETVPTMDESLDTADEKDTIESAKRHRSKSDCEIEHGVLLKAHSTGKTLVIPNTVHKIATGSIDLTGIEIISIPSSVSTVEVGAFVCSNPNVSLHFKFQKRLNLPKGFDVNAITGDEKGELDIKISGVEKAVVKYTKEGYASLITGYSSKIVFDKKCNGVMARLLENSFVKHIEFIAPDVWKYGNVRRPTTRLGLQNSLYIGNNAFANCRYMHKVDSNSILYFDYVGNNAFLNCPCKFAVPLVLSNIVYENAFSNNYAVDRGVIRIQPISVDTGCIQANAFNNTRGKFTVDTAVIMQKETEEQLDIVDRTTSLYRYKPCAATNTKIYTIPNSVLEDGVYASGGLKASEGLMLTMDKAVLQEYIKDNTVKGVKVTDTANLVPLTSTDVTDCVFGGVSISDWEKSLLAADKKYIMVLVPLMQAWKDKIAETKDKSVLVNDVNRADYAIACCEEINKKYYKDIDSTKLALSYVQYLKKAKMDYILTEGTIIAVRNQTGGLNGAMLLNNSFVPIPKAIRVRNNATTEVKLQTLSAVWEDFE